MNERLPLAVAVLAVAGLAAGCGNTAVGNAPEGGTEPFAAEEATTNVTVLTVAPGDLAETVLLSGTLEPSVEVHLSSENGGTIEELDFDKGQRVEAGALLAQVNVRLARARLAEAEAILRGAEAVHVKFERLVERKAAPEQDLVAATARRDEASARVEQARIELDRSLVTAPVAGVCLDRPVELGEVVPPGARLTTLQVNDPIRAVVGIPDSLLPFFAEGARATVEVDAHPDATFEGRIVHLAPAAGNIDRTFRSEIEVPNADGRLRPGMVARVRLVKRLHQGAVVIPEDVLVERTEGHVLFVAQDGRARLRRPAIVARADNRVVIGEGLAVGETLIVSGQQDLFEGASVRVVSGP